MWCGWGKTPPFQFLELLGQCRPLWHNQRLDLCIVLRRWLPGHPFKNEFRRKVVIFQVLFERLLDFVFKEKVHLCNSGMRLCDGGGRLGERQRMYERTSLFFASSSRSSSSRQTRGRDFNSLRIALVCSEWPCAVRALTAAARGSREH